MQKKEVPPIIDLEPLKPFIETSTELSKNDVIHRCSGKVPYSFLNLIKLLVFFRIGKTAEGKLYMF